MYKVKTWDGTNINDGVNYRAIIPDDVPFLPAVGTKFVKRLDRFPVYAGRDFGEARMSLILVDLAGDPTAVKRLFDTAVIEPKRLVVEYQGRDVYVDAVPISVELSGSSLYEIGLAVVDPIWRDVTATEQTFSISDASPNASVNVTSGFEVYPTLEITLGSSGSGGYTYRRFVKVRNQVNEQLINYPICITLDTAALVTAGKMQADGDDLRVFVDGAEAPRWISNMNTANTKVWIVLDLPGNVEMSLGAAIPASGNVDKISVKANTANDAALKKMPSAGIVEIDSELFVYSGIDLQNRELNNVQRAQKGSTAAAHSAGATIRLVPHDIWLIYGNPAATAPVQDDGRKPLFDLANSSNSSWVWPGDGFYSSSGGRSGGWAPAVLRTSGGESRIYTATQGGEADPASVMGAEANIWYKAGKIQGESMQIVWTLANPCTIGNVTASGSKYRAGNSFPGTAALQKMSGTSWSNLWNESSPGSARTWTAWSRSAVSANAKSVRFSFAGNLSAAATEQADFEVASVTATITNAPVVTLFAEEVQRWANIKVANDAGDEIRVVVPAKSGSVILIDTDNKTVTLDGQNSIGSLWLSAVRRDWLPLKPGGNTLTFSSDDGLGSLTVKVRYQGRW